MPPTPVSGKDVHRAGRHFSRLTIYDICSVLLIYYLLFIPLKKNLFSGVTHYNSSWPIGP